MRHKINISSLSCNITLLFIVALGKVLLLVSFAAHALPPGDSKGYVSAVMVLNINGRGNTFRVYFEKPAMRDSWGCISSQGYVSVTEDNPYVSETTYKQLYALALAAKSSRQVLALDSSSTNPCESVNMGWIE